ncbi:Aldose 1-epimerase [uncultured Roseburia sp.]|uniref:Aldose 1-epimerase family protein n=1 Tax=Brotonthovivens ammoniilytica TaxID=2981725 RepID=A0ABT2TQP0_9FIRM|nr:aldose 1-epimerase family protein [Brotonthovivens ammoniilytica]MCU6763784.1 aldose 1-epimerase family protein [Brotonthovivens ammoniilytica]SCJ35291.1 Aldose 1-epimerase [uncultured Roseburia sp.]
MEYTIKDNDLSVIISSHGAEMQSVSFQGREYLWQGDEAYWTEHSPVLFPFVGRFTDGHYTLEGKRYPMSIHGFAKLSDFDVIEKSDNSITLQMTDTPATFEKYPFHFIFNVTYTIKDQQIFVSYHVQNLSDQTMYFGIGGHPGFNVPLENGLAFQDYYLEFPLAHTPAKVGHTETCFLSGIDTDYPLENGNKIPLIHSMFDQDAIVLKNVCDCVTLKSDKSEHSVTLCYPDLPYLGLWHAPKTEAPYICIEPWSSLPSRQDIVEEFKYKNDLIRLKQDASYQNDWKIIIT